MPAFVDTVLVVDDGSTDGTGDRALEVGDPRVLVVTHDRRRGVGGAIVHGYEWAKDEPGGPLDTFAVMAGDGQMDPADLEAVVMPIVRGEADYVKGTRFRDEATKHVMPKARFIVGHVLSRLTGFAVGMTIEDSQCGYTAMSRALAERLPLGDIWSGFGYPNDLIARVAECGGRIEHVPVRARYGDEVSRVGARHVPRIGLIVASALWRRVGPLRQPRGASSRLNAS